MKSQEYMEGFTTALVFVSDLFEQHGKAFLRRGLLREKDTKLVVNVCNACIERREILADVGPKGVDLFVSKNRSAALKEK